jgi:phage N-6-adenine-methyltransferase
MNVHYSSKFSEWETPLNFFRNVCRIYGPFNIDVCASRQNAKCTTYYTPEDDGLSKSWAGKCWMNPPYGRSIGKWIQKAYEESLKGAIVVCLVPSRTDTKWWHNYVMKGKVEFIKGRLYFGDGKGRAPFPSALVIFGQQLNIEKGEEI